ncbi:MAG: aldehyde dehydrogenase family protein, partial [Acidimicrobiales bacterium]
MESTSATNFDVTHPGTGEHVGTWPIHTEREVSEATNSARVAAEGWASLSFRERKTRLDDFRAEIARRSDELADL